MKGADYTKRHILLEKEIKTVSKECDLVSILNSPLLQCYKMISYIPLACGRYGHMPFTCAPNPLDDRSD